MIAKCKALDREVEPYGFFLVKTLREYQDALGRGLLPNASTFSGESVTRQSVILESAKISFNAPFDYYNTF